MDSSVVANFFAAVVGAIVGGLFVLAGVWYTERETRQREAKATEAQRRRTRTLLRLEIDHNREVADSLVQRVEFNLEGDTTEMELEKRRRLIAEPRPVWGAMMWEALASQLPGALSEGAIRRLYAYHAKRYAIKRYQDAIASAVPKNLFYNYQSWLDQTGRREGPFAQTGNLYKDAEAFNKETEDKFAKCMSIIREIRTPADLVPEE